MKKKDYIITVSIVVVVIVLANAILGFSCFFKFLTGIPCPGCGLTRACTSFLRGDLKIALLYHPLFWTIHFLFLPLWKIKKYQILTHILFFITVLAFILVWIFRISNLDIFAFL